MNKYNKAEILAKTKELSDLISNQEEIMLYKSAESFINKNQRIQNLITEIKINQQELVNAKHYKITNYVKQLEGELDYLNKELHDTPLVNQYQQSQTEINKYLQEIINIIKFEVGKKIPIEKD